MEAEKLMEYRSTLMAARRRLTREIDGLEEAVREDLRLAGELSNAPTHMASAADSNLDANLGLAENEQILLQQVEEALGRIEDGSFGVCQACHKPISRERLDAIPYTPFCTACARKQESSPKWTS